MKFNTSEISDIIELAWDDQTDFSHITKLYNIDEGEVKKIMKRELKKGSYLAWRKRVARRRDKNKKSGEIALYVKSSYKNCRFSTLKS